jgi:hypothetical protein
VGGQGCSLMCRGKVPGCRGSGCLLDEAELAAATGTPAVGTIKNGTYPPGSRVPSTLEIAPEFGVVNATAAKAMRHVREQGWTRGEVGLGTLVTDPLPPSPETAEPPAWPKRSHPRLPGGPYHQNRTSSSCRPGFVVVTVVPDAWAGLVRLAADQTIRAVHSQSPWVPSRTGGWAPTSLHG